MATITEFSKQFGERVASTVLQIETAMARDNVEPDVRANLRGQLRATRAFADDIGRILCECESSVWQELYHRLGLALIERRIRYEEILEEHDAPLNRTRFSGSASATGFLIRVLGDLHAEIRRGEATDRERAEPEEGGVNAGRSPDWFGSSEPKGKRCRVCHVPAPDGGLNEHGVCAMCATHGVQGAAARRVARKREERRIAGLAGTRPGGSGRVG